MCLLAEVAANQQRFLQIPDQIAGDRAGKLLGQTEQLAARVDQLASDLVPGVHRPLRLEIFHGYIGVFAVAFLVTLIATPIMLY